MSCIFCEIINGTIPSSKEYEDESVIVIKDIHPQAPVHLLVIPKRHIQEFTDMPEELLTHVLTTAKQTIKDHAITQYRLVNNGKGAAMVDHFHLHILGSIDKSRTL